jgi:polysaccharide pyruvyl transferase WcaK-like protein
MKIGLLGISFDTGNMGVSALAESSIKVILNRWPNAEVTLLDSGSVVDEEQLRIGDKNILIKKIPIRFCKNIFLENHFIVLCFYAFLFKVCRWDRFKRFCARRNSGLASIIEMNMTADITGGDSFSDIYGMRRFILGFLRKWLILQFNKSLIMLPQTYGPFKRSYAGVMARYILKRAKVIYSRDHAGVEYVQRLLGDSRNGQLKFSPDVAFVLDPRRPDGHEICSIEEIKNHATLIGLNVSGLLGCCGNAEDNVFGLKVDYLALIKLIIESLMKRDDSAILLVPHSGVPPESGASPRRKMRRKGYREQSDAITCEKIYRQFSAKYSDRIFLVRGRYNHNETKYIIGLCDFFIGSRMHSCIAALSQNIPAAGIAYSKKFYGVFESIGAGDCVVDARNFDEREVVEKLETVFGRKDQIHKHLEDVIPQVKIDILDIFDVSGLKELSGGNVEQYTD